MLAKLVEGFIGPSICHTLVKSFWIFSSCSLKCEALLYARYFLPRARRWKGKTSESRSLRTFRRKWNDWMRFEMACMKMWPHLMKTYGKSIVLMRESFFFASFSSSCVCSWPTYRRGIMMILILNVQDARSSSNETKGLMKLINLQDPHPLCLWQVHDMTPKWDF